MCLLYDRPGIHAQSSNTGRVSSAIVAGSAGAKARGTAAAAAAGGACSGSSKTFVRAAQKLLHDAQAQAQQVDRALTITAAAGLAANRAAASSAADDHRNSPLGTVLAQYKESQAAWAQEKVSGTLRSPTESWYSGKTPHVFLCT